MNTVLIVARAALAGVFAVAAVAKLADMPGSRAALEGFGIAKRFVAPSAIALPAAELLTAVLLVPAGTAQAGAALGVALLLVFVAGITAALRRGAAPDCHCFGQLHSRPAGRETLIRNGVLAAVALLVLVGGPGPALDTWASDSGGERVALVAVALLAAILGYACLALWQENRRLTGRTGVPDLPVQVQPGQRAPAFEVVDIADAKLGSHDLLHDQPTVLVFTSATCGPCVGLLPELSRWRGMLSERLAIHVLASGDQSENRRLSVQHGMPVFFDRDGAAANAFGVYGTPSAVEIDATGAVVTPPAPGAPAIEGLIRAALKRPALAAGFEVRQVPEGV